MHGGCFSAANFYGFGEGISLHECSLWYCCYASPPIGTSTKVNARQQRRSGGDGLRVPDTAADQVGSSSFLFVVLTIARKALKVIK